MFSTPPPAEASFHRASCGQEGGRFRNKRQLPLWFTYPLPSHFIVCSRMQKGNCKTFSLLGNLTSLAFLGHELSIILKRFAFSCMFLLPFRQKHYIAKIISDTSKLKLALQNKIKITSLSYMFFIAKIFTLFIPCKGIHN